MHFQHQFSIQDHPQPQPLFFINTVVTLIIFITTCNGGGTCNVTILT
jgi:hypothetical protein